MRKNTQEVIGAWTSQIPGGDKGGSIWTDGESIYSYQTCILTFSMQTNPYSPVVILNLTQYSPTTSSKQNEIAEWLRRNPQYGVECVNSDELRRGSGPHDLYEVSSKWGEE